jgi:hypothetical protein
MSFDIILLQRLDVFDIHLVLIISGLLFLSRLRNREFWTIRLVS